MADTGVAGKNNHLFYICENAHIMPPVSAPSPVPSKGK